MSGHRFFIREHLRDPDLSIDQISAALSCTKRYLHMLFSDRGHHHQRLYPACKVAELPPGSGDPGRKKPSRTSHFRGAFRVRHTSAGGVPEVFRNCSVCDSQSAARWSVPGLSLRIEFPLDATGRYLARVRTQGDGYANRWRNIGIRSSSPRIILIRLMLLRALGRRPQFLKSNI